MFNEEDKRPNPVKRLRAVHHHMAMMFAMGMGTSEVADELGYCVSRVSILRNSPAMEELIRAYLDDVTGGWQKSVVGYFGLKIKARNMAQRMIVDQMEKAEENGDEIPLRTLLALEADAADRTGYPKRSMAINVNVDFATQLDRAVKRSEKVLKQEGKVIPFVRRV
jgi:hypothetical protein